jgi:hypothetical protein
VSLKVFSDDDDGFERWLAQHPDGFVLNDARSPTLHTAHCDHIDITRGRGNVRWTATSGKVCAIDAAALLLWAEAAQRGSPVRCRDCAP